MEDTPQTVDSPSGGRPHDPSQGGAPTASSGVCTPRPDGRSSAMEMRPISVQLGLIKNADGSARISQGLTSVTSIVLGPLESPPGAKCLSNSCYFHVIVRFAGSLPLLPHRQKLPTSSSFSSRVLSGPSGDLQQPRLSSSSSSSSSSFVRSSPPPSLADQKNDWEKSMECQLHALLQHMVVGSEYPRCLVQVSLLISQDDGGLEAVCVNAALASVLDAGLSLRYRAWSAALVKLVVRPSIQTRRGGERDAPLSPAPTRGEGADKEEEEEERAGGGGQTEWMVDPCREEEEDGRKEAEKIFVFEPQTGDLVSALFKRESERNDSQTVNLLPRFSAEREGHRVLGHQRELNGQSKAGRGIVSERYAVCEAGQTVAGGGALDFSSNELDVVFARGLGAARVVDRFVRSALRRKMESACTNFELNNFWWSASPEAKASRATCSS